MRKLAAKILGWKSENTYYEWRKQQRPVLQLLELIGEKRLEEFLKTGKIKDLQHKSKEFNEEEFELFITYTAVNKILVFKEKKSPFPVVKIFEEILENNTMIDSVPRLMAAIKDHQTKWNQHENWKTIINDFLHYQMSDVEVKMMFKNKHLILGAFK